MAAPTAANLDRLTRQLQAADSKCAPSLEALTEALASLAAAQEQIEAGLEGLLEDAQDLRAAAESEQADVDAALQRLSAAAAGGAEERIPGVGEAVREARATCGAAFGEAATGLTERGGSLQESGLAPLRSALEEAGGRDDASGTEARTALEGLANSCSAVADGLVTAGSGAADRLGQAGERLAAEVAQSLVQTSEAAIAELDAEAAATKDGALRVESEIVAAYGAWTGDVEAARAAHAELMTAAAEATKSTLIEALESGFCTPCQALEAGAVQGAQQTLAEVLGSTDGWLSDANELGTTVDELYEGHAAMGRINQAAQGPG